MAFRPISLLFVALAVPGAVLAQNQLVSSFPLNSYVRYLDGQWEGVHYASDGNVYFASSSQSAHHGAAFFRYNPATQQLTMLAADITLICGEDPQTNPQGKIHSNIPEMNGWLFFTTHFGAEGRPGGITGWTGGHLVGYRFVDNGSNNYFNTPVGGFHDYGVIYPGAPGYTSYSGIAADPAQNYLYVFATGEVSGQVSFVFRYNAATDNQTTRVNLGPVYTSFGASLYWFVDSTGDVWFAIFNDNGAMHRIHHATGVIDRYDNALPAFVRQDSNTVDPTFDRAIQWMAPISGTKAIFTYNAGGMLYQFDTSQTTANSVPAAAFTNLQWIGPSYIGSTIGANRVFFYQRANGAIGHQGCDTADTTLPPACQDYHLMSVSLDPATGYAITDHGLLMDQSGRTVWRIPSMMTDGTNNNVFMVGDWWTYDTSGKSIPGDDGVNNTLRYHYSAGVESYIDEPRGEFFAVARVSTSTSSPSVSLTSPANGSTVSGSVTLTALASGNGGVAGVQFEIDGVAIGNEITTSPYTILWDSTTVANGAHTLTATARDSAGNRASSSISITVNNVGVGPPFTPIRVRAGGPAYTDSQGHVWSADYGYSGVGGTYSTSAPIAGTSDQPLYQTERWTWPGGLGYDFTVPSGTYTVTFKFSENYATGRGQRVFNVVVNGQTMAPNFDIYAAAGGGFHATDLQFTVSASGTMSIQFVPVVGGPKVDAIAIVQQGSTSAPPLTLACPAGSGTANAAYSSALIVTGGVTPYTFSISSGSLPNGLTLNTSSGAITGAPTVANTFNFTAKVVDSSGNVAANTVTSNCSIVIAPVPAPGGFSLRVRAGGPAYTDSQGHVWSADYGYSGVGGTYSTSAPIAGTSDQPLYQTERWTWPGGLGYDFTVPSGTYTVTLKFSENYATGRGQRVFNVVVNGQTMATNFDIYAAAGGGFHATDLQFTVSASATMSIQFVPVVGGPKVDAIAIF
jgi:hypothetical protein